MISGSVKYDPEPLEPAAAGNLLICCSRPQEAARPVFMLRVVSRLVRPEFLVVIEIVAAKA